MKKLIFITIIIIFFSAPFTYAHEENNNDGLTVTVPEITTFDKIPTNKILDGFARLTKGLDVAGKNTISFFTDLLNGKIKFKKDSSTTVEEE